jgi:DNA-directed RNA polymerase alpha subunit
MTDSPKPSPLNSAQVPNPLARLSIDQLPISVRSFNALKANGILTFGQLVRISDNELLGFYAFGRKSLEDVHRAIDEVSSEYGFTREVSSQAVKQTPESTPNWPIMKDGRILSPGGWIVPSNRDEDLDTSVDVLDLSPRPAKVLAGLRLFSLRQLLNYPKLKFAHAKNIGRKSIAEIETKLCGYLAGERSIDVVRRDGLLRPTAPQHRSGTKDLVTQILSQLPERSRNILNTTS